MLEYGSGPLPLPRTIAYAAEQLHQQDVWQIASAYGGRYRLGEGKETVATWLRAGAIRIVRDYLLVIGILAYNRQCSGAALPRRRPKGDLIAIRRLSGRS